MRRRWPVLGALVVTLTATGCGSQLPHEQIVAAQQGDGTAGTSGAAGATGTSVGTGGGTTAGVAGTSTVGGATPGSGTGGYGGSTTGGSTAGAATSTAGGGTGHSTTGGRTGAAAGSPILLGNVGTYSGLSSTQAQGREALQVWVHWINDRGGLAGHPVRLFTADDQGDSNRAAQLVKSMVENDHVLAFVGNQASLTIDGYQKYLEDNHIPLIGGDVVTTNWNTSPMLFPQAAAIDKQLLGVPLAAHNAGKKRLGLLYCAESDACKYVHDLLWDGGGAKREGMAAGYSASVSLAQPDFTSECLQAQQDGVDALYIASDTNSVNRVAHDCLRQGYHPMFMAAASTLASTMADNPQLEGLTGDQGMAPWFEADTPATREFHDAVAKYDPNMMYDSAAADGWDSGKLFEKVAAHFPAGAVTRTDIFNGLYAIHGETLGGLVPPINFVRGRAAPMASCIYPVVIRNGKWSAPNGHNSVCVK